MLEDFGTSGFRRRLDDMLDQLVGRPGSNDEAIAGIRGWLVDLLVDRARLLDGMKKNPGWETMRPIRPIVVTGVPGAPIGATVKALIRGNPDLWRPSGSTDPDLTTEWLSLSMAGFSFERLAGVAMPTIGCSEWAEIIDLHRLAWAAATTPGEAAMGRPVFAGADHLHAIEPLRDAYPDVRIAIVPVDRETAVSSCIDVERSAMGRLGFAIDLEDARRRWRAHVEHSERIIDGLVLREDPLELATGATAALPDEADEDHPTGQ
jgi:hypothetical protein